MQARNLSASELSWDKLEKFKCSLDFFEIKYSAFDKNLSIAHYDENIIYHMPRVYAFFSNLSDFLDKGRIFLSGSFVPFLLRCTNWFCEV